MEELEREHKRCMMLRRQELALARQELVRQETLPTPDTSKIEMENMLLRAKLEQLQKETLQLQAQVKAENLMREKLEQRRKELDAKVIEENRAMQEHIALQGKIIENDSVIKAEEKKLMSQLKDAKLTALSQGKSTVSSKVSTPSPIKLSRKISTLTKNGSLKRGSKIDYPKVE